METRTTAAWVSFCADHDIPAGPVRTLDDLVAELPIAEHPVAGSHHVVPSPVRFSATPASVRSPAPRIGEHNREVLVEVGMTEAEIDALLAADALRTPPR